MAKVTSAAGKKIHVSFPPSPSLDPAHPFDAKLIETVRALENVNVCLNRLDDAIDQLCTGDTGTGAPAQMCASPAVN
jgi:hypothetical protein